MKWVRAKSKKDVLTEVDVKNCLGKLFCEIRFAEMTIGELCSLTEKYSPVLKNDFMAFANMIATKSAPQNFEVFNMSPRKVLWNESNNMGCSFKNANTCYYRNQKKFTTKFTTNRPILLGGFTCGRVGTFVGAFQNLKSLVFVDVEIIEARDFHSENGTSLLQTKIKLESVETDVRLPNTIFIRPDYVYEISIGCLPDGHVFQSDNLKTSVILRSNIELNVQQTKISSGKAVGLIQGLALNSI